MNTNNQNKTPFSASKIIPLSQKDDGENQSGAVCFPFYQPIVIFLFGLCLSCLLAFALQAGRLVEYRIPLFLMEIKTGFVFGVFCFLSVAVISGISLNRAFAAEDPSKNVLSRSRRVSYFFSVLATLSFTAYICAVAIYYLKAHLFLNDCLYLAFLYLIALSFHFKAGKSPLAHAYTTAAFILIMTVTGFYGGIASVKLGGKHITSVNGELFALAESQKDNYILAGYNSQSNRMNGKFIVLPAASDALKDMTFYPLK